jgi:hypothetical protein
VALACGSGAAGGKGGALPQPASVPTISTVATNQGKPFMGLILLEALLALVLLVGIVWWTMFSGRDKGELPDDEDGHPKHPPTLQAKRAAAPAPRSRRTSKPACRRYQFCSN